MHVLFFKAEISSRDSETITLRDNMSFSFSIQDDFPECGADEGGCCKNLGSDVHGYLKFLSHSSYRQQAEWEWREENGLTCSCLKESQSEDYTNSATCPLTKAKGSTPSGTAQALHWGCHLKKTMSIQHFAPSDVILISCIQNIWEF